MSQDTHTPHATVEKSATTPNPLWVITVGMAVFFAAGAAIMAVI